MSVDLFVAERIWPCHAGGYWFSVEGIVFNARHCRDGGIGTRDRRDEVGRPSQGPPLQAAVRPDRPAVVIDVAFERIEKAWMTVTDGGDVEIPEFFEIDWSLVDYPCA